MVQLLSLAVGNLERLIGEPSVLSRIRATFSRHGASGEAAIFPRKYGSLPAQTKWRYIDFLTSSNAPIPDPFGNCCSGNLHFVVNPDADLHTSWSAAASHYPDGSNVYTQILESKHFPLHFAHTNAHTLDPPPLHSTHQTVFFFFYHKPLASWIFLLSSGALALSRPSVLTLSHIHTQTHKAKTNTINYSRLLF